MSTIHHPSFFPKQPHHWQQRPNRNKYRQILMQQHFLASQAIRFPKHLPLPSNKQIVEMAVISYVGIVALALVSAGINRIVEAAAMGIVHIATNAATELFPMA